MYGGKTKKANTMVDNNRAMEFYDFHCLSELMVRIVCLVSQNNIILSSLLTKLTT